MMEKTLSILKPDAVARNLTGKINSMLEEAGFKIVAQKMIHMSKEKAQGFYIVHKERPFYDELTTYMSKADEGTIRAKYALSVGENSVHGSDSLENAKTEIAYFFTDDEICER